LIELMVTVSLMAILLAIGVPYLREFFIANRLASATNELMTSLSLARNEAMRRGTAVTMRRQSATARNWGQGWEIFLDANANGTRQSTEELIRTGPAISSPITVYSTAGLQTWVIFNADGRLASVAGGYFVICNDNVLQEGGRSRSRAVIVNPAGRIRAGADANGNGIPENDAGADVASCTAP
jgi:type IV fimbrial biogenesis protein FimT